MTAKVGLLSGGQRQALTLLMATLRKPKLLLLDEHTAALDPRTAEKVLQLSQKIISRTTLMTMMVTHNMRDAIDYGNRLIMMYEARSYSTSVRGEEAPHRGDAAGAVRARQRRRVRQRPRPAVVSGKRKAIPGPFVRTGDLSVRRRGRGCLWRAGAAMPAPG